MSKSTLTVEAAKAAVLAEEKRIASVIPAAYVEELKQLDSAYLISCPDGGYTWPDKSTIVLTGSPDISELLARVASSYQKQHGFSVEVGDTQDGAGRVTISAADGANYFLSPTVEGSDLALSSFSACFELRPKQWPGDAF